MIAPGGGASASGYYGFSWAFPLLGPIAPLLRDDWRTAITVAVLQTAGLLFATYIDPSWLLPNILISWIAISTAWSPFYNEIHLARLMRSGFQIADPGIVSAMGKRSLSAILPSRNLFLYSRAIGVSACAFAIMQFAIFTIENGDYFRLVSAAPSFKCSDATESLQFVICADADLARADGRMGAIYQRKLRQSSAEQNGVEESQRAWVLRRAALCNVPPSPSIALSEAASIKPCILNVTSDRIAELRRL